MILIIDDFDISAYVQSKQNVKERPIYVNGANLGTAKTGTPIFNRIKTRYALSWALKPLPQSVYQQIIAKCEANELSVQYETARASTTQTRSGQPSLSEWQFATTWAGEKIYHGCVLTVELK